MKFITGMIVMIAALIGCTEKESPKSETLEFTDGSKSLTVTIPGEGKVQTVGFNAGTDWTVIPSASVPTHFKLTPMSGSAGSNEVTLDIAENPGINPLACDYKITGANGDVISLRVEQEVILQNFYFSLFWEDDKNIGTRYETEVSWKEENTFAPNIVSDIAWYADGSGAQFLSQTEGTGNAGIFLFMKENSSSNPKDYEITFHRKDNDQLLGIMVIHQQAKPVEHKLEIGGKTGKNALSIYNWFGKKVELDLRSTPAVDFAELSYTNVGQDENLTVDTSSGKIILNYKGTELINDYQNTLVISDPNYPENYVEVDVYYRTVGWISDLENNGKYKSDKPFYYVGGASDNWSYTWSDSQGDKAKYFIAYYSKDATEFDYNIGAIPHLYYPDSYVPTSEYSLVSGDPSVLDITKKDAQSYQLVVKNKVFQKVPITYTCGDYSQTYNVKLNF